MEEDLNKLIVEYPSNHWLDLPKFLNLGSGYQTQIKNARNEVDPQRKKTLKYQMMNNSVTTDRIFLTF